MSQTPMNRRTMLKYTALLTGGAVSASFASVFLSGCSSPAEEVSELHFFDPGQFELVSLLADTILPRTDSPSATDVNVHHTIDTMIGLVFEMEFKTNFRIQWGELENHLADLNFRQLGQADRVELLRNLELSRISETENARGAYRELKQQVIAYYLTTEEIGKNYLNYLPVPGDYEPCISVDDVGNRAWAI
ncbi:MAG: gluconate 2-dehydrogenase subunit 3 family protein [Balneolaceae bacterium]|nr:MAG: gluconate 2-dehydrogenase subunit 3 family protein [Balneolaceae bacterium]